MLPDKVSAAEFRPYFAHEFSAFMGTEIRGISLNKQTQ
jgi:hypothetical protein